MSAPRLSKIEQQVLTLLRKIVARVLMIDELSNILAGNSVSRRKFLNVLCLLGNELCIPLICVDT